MRNHDMDMVHGPLVKNMLIFAFPLVVTNLLQMVFSAADTIIVGHFAGQIPLAAVGSTTSLIFLLSAIFNGLGIGANIVIAKALGSKDVAKAHRSLNTGMVLAIVGGAILTIVGMGSAKFLLELMKTPSDIINLSTLYMRINFIGSIPMLIYNIGAAALRSKGDTKRPMYFLAISGVINVFLNIIFVTVFKIDVAGVALATIISQLIAAILIIKVLMDADGSMHLDLKHVDFDKDIAKEILYIGIPAGAQGMIFAIANVVIQSSINSFDSSVIIAGNTAAANVESFVYIGMQAFSQATMTFTSQNLGAKNYSRIKKILFISMVIGCGLGAGVGFVIYYFGEFFLSLYNSDPLVIEVGIIRLFWIASLLFLNGILDIFVNSLRGMGHTLSPTIITIVGICCVRLLWIWFVFPKYNTLNVIYMCYPLSWIVTSIVEMFLWIKVYHNLVKA